MPVPAQQALPWTSKDVPNRGCNNPPLFWNLLVFWQNVLVKFPDPMLSVNLEYFIIKNEMQNSINIQFRRNQTFTGDDGF